MAQNRPPPAFMEYAAAMMARVEYRVLNLAERGLLYSMRLECWVNHGLPANAATLSKILGFPADEVSASLPSMKPFFAERDGFFVSPELEDYRTHITALRAKQSEGGKQSAANKKDKPKTVKTLGAQATKEVTSNLRDTSKSLAGNLQVLSSDQPNPVQPSQPKSSVEEVFGADYERASNGA